MIHPTSDVQSITIGDDTKIWQFCVVLEKARIGKNCNINSHVFVENDVIIGDNVTIKSGVQLWDGVEIQDNVFIGPNVTFTNDVNPRSKVYPQEFKKTQLMQGCSIGANSTILPGISIGKFAMIGAASLISKDVPDFALVYGSPAKLKGWVDAKGIKMGFLGDNLWKDSQNCFWKEMEGKLVKQ
jgi:UDP-2-acetamido-3-amino-2,3-dideoxy-glucuronate N-acetyltransferase